MKYFRYFYKALNKKIKKLSGLMDDFAKQKSTG